MTILLGAHHLDAADPLQTWADRLRRGPPPARRRAASA